MPPIMKLPQQTSPEAHWLELVQPTDVPMHMFAAVHERMPPAMQQTSPALQVFVPQGTPASVVPLLLPLLDPLLLPLVEPLPLVLPPLVLPLLPLVLPLLPLVLPPVLLVPDPLLVLDPLLLVLEPLPLLVLPPLVLPLLVLLVLLPLELVLLPPSSPVTVDESPPQAIAVATAAPTDATKRILSVFMQVLR